MFTHARCGGVLIPIANTSVPHRPNNLAPLIVRCNKCGRPGEVAEVMDPWREMEALWKGLVSK